MATSLNATPTPITPPRVAVLDPRTGLISREWYMFFLSLFRTAEGAVNADTNGPTTVSLVASLDAAIDRVQQETQTLPVSVLEQVQPLLDDLAQQIGTMPQVDPQVSARSILPFAITPGASPYTYQNTNTYSADVIVSGGGVSLLEFSRNGAAFFSTGSFYGMFTLSPYDLLRVTYSSAPTMTLVPR